MRSQAYVPLTSPPCTLQKARRLPVLQGPGGKQPLGAVQHFGRCTLSRPLPLGFRMPAPVYLSPLLKSKWSRLGPCWASTSVIFLAQTTFRAFQSMDLELDMERPGGVGPSQGLRGRQRVPNPVCLSWDSFVALRMCWLLVTGWGTTPHPFSSLCISIRSLLPPCHDERSTTGCFCPTCHTAVIRTENQLKRAACRLIDYEAPNTMAPHSRLLSLGLIMHPS